MSAALLFALGQGANVTSSLMQGWMADYESRAEQRLFERNAVIAEQNATARLEKARFDSQRAAGVGEAVTGRLTAQLGASGARLDVGAPIALLAEQASELELEQILIVAEAETEALQLRDRATMLRFAGETARRRGKNARRASLINAFGKGAETFGRGQELGFIGGASSAGGANKAGQAITIDPVGKTRVITLKGKSRRSLGTLRGRRPTRGGFAGTNRSSATPFGSVSA